MVQEALQRQAPLNYVGVHPHQDFGSLPSEKNVDLVQIGYCNVNGIPVHVVGNDLDVFFGVEANINWKRMLEEGQLSKLFCSENAIHIVTS
jgi:hypothetical protein